MSSDRSAPIGPDSGRSADQRLLSRVSLCMIVRDEEKNLPACLSAVRELVDEVIVVDTGSTDRTKEAAAGLGAKVLDFAWCDSFAAARNESLARASGDWVFWLDADDRLDEENLLKLGNLFTSLKGENAAYLMKCLCPPAPGEAHSAVIVEHARLFRRVPGVEWRYRVHEQILLSVKEHGGQIRHADVTIRHVGYHEGDGRRAKLDRNLRLLQMDLAEHPDDAYVRFNLGWVYLQLRQPDEAGR
jgi:glycosyltransferase involved in cell wall biosynthesis